MISLALPQRHQQIHHNPGANVPQSSTTQNNNLNCDKNNVKNFFNSVVEFKTNFTYEKVINSLLHLETCGILMFNRDKNEITFLPPKHYNFSIIVIYELIEGRNPPEGAGIGLQGFETSFHKLLYSLCTKNERSDNIDDIKKIREIADQFNQRFGEYGTFGVAIRQGFRSLTKGGKRTKRKRTKTRRAKSRRTKTSRRK